MANKLAIESLKERVQYFFDDPAGVLQDGNMDDADEFKEAAAHYWAELIEWANELEVDIIDIVFQESTEYERSRMIEEYGLVFTSDHPIG